MLVAEETFQDEHWIKLDYESQRESSRLVAFGPVQSRPRPAASAGSGHR